jgi:indole-3-glycerol phosphate synthase
MTILDEIVAKRKQRLAGEQDRLPLSEIHARLQDAPDRVRDFPQALRGSFVRVIAEIKRASPSEGELGLVSDPRFLAQDYAGGGAAALSVLTEQDYFQGEAVHLTRARKFVPLPVLRKDFIVDPYQVYHSRLIGADALLLIATVLDDHELRDLLALTHALGMNALVETHDEYDMVRALYCGARVVGINNRNLKTMHTDLAQTEKLARMVPVDRLLVSESGIHGREDIARVAAAGVDAVLVGTMLVKSEEPGLLLRTLVEVPADAERRKGD